MGEYFIVWLIGVLVSILVYAAWILPTVLEKAQATKTELSTVLVLTVVTSFLFSWVNLLVIGAFSAIYFGKKWELQEQNDREYR